MEDKARSEKGRIEAEETGGGPFVFYEDVMKMEQQQAEARAERERMEAKLAPREAATQAQLAALQARIESMHAAKLLSDDELCALDSGEGAEAGRAVGADGVRPTVRAAVHASLCVRRDSTR